MTEMYLTLVPVVSGGVDVKCRPYFTTSSGLARTAAEEHSHMGATYHTLTLSDPLPTSS